MTDQEIDAIREQFATCDPTYGRWHTDESKLRAFARAILSRAIPEGHVVVPKEPTPEIMAAAGIAAWPTASAADIELAKKAADIVLMAMEAAPGMTRDMLASILATMAPAYRAMIAAAPANKEV